MSMSIILGRMCFLLSKVVIHAAYLLSRLILSYGGDGDEDMVVRMVDHQLLYCTCTVKPTATMSTKEKNGIVSYSGALVIHHY